MSFLKKISIIKLKLNLLNIDKTQKIKICFVIIKINKIYILKKIYL